MKPVSRSTSIHTAWVDHQLGIMAVFACLRLIRHDNRATYQFAVDAAAGSRHQHLELPVLAKSAIGRKVPVTGKVPQ
jgi:hypothetical protein